MMPFILDEATRAIVALEMEYSGNFIVPTINGEFYYNKPPLFNWIQVLFVKITGNTDEFIFRLPVVLSLFLFSITVYLTQKKEAGKMLAFFAALSVLTCGRILLYDSLKGLIDITFSWVIYLLFWYIFHFGRRKEYYNLFLVAYLLATIGFLMKGLPALVFLAISLLAYFMYHKDIKPLFSVQHLAGFALFLVVAGAYLFVYSRYNSLENYFGTLWSESSKRTFIDNSLWESVKHLFLFPLDFIYHFLPWTLLTFVFLFKTARKATFNNEFGRFALWVFLSNILIYWLSPAIYPRYLFMFLPLTFYLIFFAYFEILKTRQLYINVNSVFVIFSILLLLLILSVPLIAEREIYNHFYLKYASLILLALPPVYLLIYRKVNRILLFISFLLIARIAFNWFVIPDRIENGTDLYQKNGAIVAAELSASEPLYLLEDTRIHHVSTYYIMRTREDILTRWYGKPNPQYLYIAEKQRLKELPEHQVVFTFETRIEGLKLCLIRFNHTKAKMSLLSKQQ
jgi:4-amino-4-deoxy-L-arabinose transferase-like glycosyltransferase